MTPAQQVTHFLATGEHDTIFKGWPGDSVVSSMNAGASAMTAALVAEVRRRAKGRKLPTLPPDFHPGRFVHAKVGPMVRGLFPVSEQPAVLRLFENSLIFVTSDNIDQILEQMKWLSTAWNIANLYLGSLGLTALDNNPARLVGLSEETTFYVSMAYFEEEDPFADYVVHEAAHVFHNWKRDLAGLNHTRNREFLLQIDFTKRELFAYACETYSRILEQAGNKVCPGAVSKGSLADRQRLLADYVAVWITEDDRLNQAELVDVLTEAVTTRNGWKRILQRCTKCMKRPKSD